MSINKFPTGTYVYKENDKEIVCLPILGNSISIQTIKQGREGNLRQASRDRLITPLVVKEYRSNNYFCYFY